MFLWDFYEIQNSTWNVNDKAGNVNLAYVVLKKINKLWEINFHIFFFCTRRSHYFFFCWSKKSCLRWNHMLNNNNEITLKIHLKWLLQMHSAHAQIFFMYKWVQYTKPFVVCKSATNIFKSFLQKKNFFLLLQYKFTIIDVLLSVMGYTDERCTNFFLWIFCFVLFFFYIPHNHTQLKGIHGFI